MTLAQGLSGLVQKTRLNSGLRIVTESVPFVRSVALGIWVQVGSRDEQAEEQGLSHFLEHMLFKGTQKRNAFEIAHSLESLGGSLDAFTSRDVTCFYARCLDEHLSDSLDVISDMLQHSIFDPEEIEKEKRVVLEEIQTVEDTPDDLIHDLFAKSVWGEDPVGAPIMGAPVNVQSFFQEKLISFLGQHYHPERIVIAVAGNLDHNKIVDEVGRLFHFPVAHLNLPERKQPQEVLHANQHFQRDIGQTHICLGTIACAYTHPRRTEQMIANTALGEGMSSRLFQEIRERLGLAYSVYSYLEMLEDTGLFGTYMACDSARVEEAVNIAQLEIKRLKQEGISDQELKSSKAQLRGELILGQESMDNRMGRIAQQEMYTGQYCSVEESLSNIEAVTQLRVLEACQTLLDADHLHRVTVGP
ncbi:MAG: insulinase family protein [Candidatus Latescibacteria bacterium]|nr:insulinase family protein [Candidatus Latescibacterota bacterium]